MGINIYTLSDEKCLEVKPLSGDAVQTKVSCQGDIAVVPFYPDENTHGTAWLLLQERNTGEIGRDVPGNDPLDLRHAEGVLIGAKDPRSLDVIIEALTMLRDRLGFGEVMAEVMAIKAREDIEDECARGMVKQTAGDVDRALLEEMDHDPKV